MVEFLEWLINALTIVLTSPVWVPAFFAIDIGCRAKAWWKRNTV